MNARALTLSWIGLSILYAGSLTLIQRVEISKELEIRSTALTHQVSQRADQHDAHLTGLSALALAGQEPNAALFLEVVAAIRQFYPRVIAVDLVSLHDDSDIISSRDGQWDANSLQSVIKLAAQRSTGALELMLSPEHEDHYLIIKRVPNSSAARFALCFEISTQHLVNIEEDFWQRKNTELLISLPNGTQLSRFSDRQETQTSTLFSPLTVTNTLQSRTQPLSLSSTVHVSANELIPIGPFLLGLLLLGIILLLATTIFRLYAKSRQAEKRALLGEHEARISHASRVNSLGELSSGIAHELTQPLTAILSQSQAGLRMINNAGKPDEAVVSILNATVTQAKRASNILARLRNWTTHTTESRQPVGVNECVQNVLLLLDAEIKSLPIDLTVKLSAENPYVLCDSVEFEQVVFNLIRNALDKVAPNDTSQLSVHVTSTVVEDQIILNIEDDGAQVDLKLLDRIFEPFVTSRDNGMGLGLALCERILSRMEGNIEIYNIENGVVVRVGVPKYVHSNEE